MEFKFGLTNSDYVEEVYYIISPKGKKLYFDGGHRHNDIREFVDEINGYLETNSPLIG